MGTPHCVCVCVFFSVVSMAKHTHTHANWLTRQTQASRSRWLLRCLLQQVDYSFNAHTLSTVASSCSAIDGFSFFSFLAKWSPLCAARNTYAQCVFVPTSLSIVPIASPYQPSFTLEWISRVGFHCCISAIRGFLSNIWWPIFPCHSTLPSGRWIGARVSWGKLKPKREVDDKISTQKNGCPGELKHQN